MPWRCPTCSGCRGHPEPPIWIEPKESPGDHREIWKCCRCSQVICACCYVLHIEQRHPELYVPRS